MTKMEILKLIRRRYGISRRAATAYAKDRAISFVNYHEGCMGVLLCLEADVKEAGRKPPKAKEAPHVR